MPDRQNGFILQFSFVFNSSMSYVRFKGLHFFWLTPLQGEPCLDVMGYDKESVASLRRLKMLTDLKVTNEIHSSEFASSHNMPPTQTRECEKPRFSGKRLGKHKSLASP